ncbi:unnamed protein product [Ceutorhynchus assimilis]|uniref:Periodic tryptophan protein 1 n=1 Tax=Ceutorhynchus assimilis TaxID=467358 RepID=A0A9P0DSF2_9CUCU|nr:unnamed protein product [Ceutorhynchus assimilis]
MENELLDRDPHSNINFTPCVRWVKRNVARSVPLNVQLSKNELVEIIKDTKEKLGIAESRERTDSEDAPMEAGTTSTSADDEFNFAEYDKDDNNETAQTLGIHSLAELPNEIEAEDHFSESDDSEKEDDIIKPTDNLILVAHVEGDASLLEVYVYNNDEEESFYVHHDILLPSFPLCLEWLNYEKGQAAGNYCAVGSMSPVIDVWDLDIMNCLEPAFKLGKVASAKKKRAAIGHKDAVLALGTI